MSSNIVQVKLKDDVKAAWLEALESGRYEQGVGALTLIDSQGTRRDCCLGVLCDVAVLQGLAVDVGWSDGGTRGTAHYDAQAGLLPLSVFEWATGERPHADSEGYDFEVVLPNLDYDPEHPRNDAPTYESSLAEANDEGRDFGQIAALIREQL